MMTDRPGRAAKTRRQPPPGRQPARSAVVLAAVGLIIALELLQHLVLRPQCNSCYHAVTGSIQALILISCTLAYLRWRRHAEQSQQAFEQLREAESLRDDLTAMLVHDLKNPLISASMALQNVLRHQAPISCLQEEELAMLTIARDSQVRLLGMIEDLLDIARAEAGELQIAGEPVDLCGIAEQAAEETRGPAERAGLKLEVECAGPAVGVSGDPRKLRRVADNLLANAVKFTPEGGQVWLRVFADEAGAHLQVRDTGRGIPAEMHEWIFDKFAQVRGDQRYSVGLGLTYAKHAIEAHGGTIKLESEVGQGSTFTVTLPEAKGEAATE